LDNLLLAVVIVLTLVVLVLVIAVFALARQVGILHTRLAPAGALMTNDGPAVGQPAPKLAMQDIAGTSVTIGGPLPRPQLILFTSPSCPVCKQLVPVARGMANDEKLSLVFASDGGEIERHETYRKDMKLEGYPYVVSLELGLKFEVGKLPYAVLIDETGVLRSKGLVNSREHLESLVESMLTGYESIQDYLVKEHQLEQAS
jgi:methylamine dehydrogenase accessory protein MauD